MESHLNVLPIVKHNECQHMDLILESKSWKLAQQSKLLNVIIYTLTPKPVTPNDEFDICDLT
jgi:hypothetical protein